MFDRVLDTPLDTLQGTKYTSNNDSCDYLRDAILLIGHDLCFY